MCYSVKDSLHIQDCADHIVSLKTLLVSEFELYCETMFDSHMKDCTMTELW